MAADSLVGGLWNAFDKEDYGGELRGGHYGQRFVVRAVERGYVEGGQLGPIPWPDTLNDVKAEQAAWKPTEDPQCRSIWERRLRTSPIGVGLPSTGWPVASRRRKMRSIASEFAVPAPTRNETEWQGEAEIDKLRETQDAIATAIQDPASDLTKNSVSPDSRRLPSWQNCANQKDAGRQAPKFLEAGNREQGHPHSFTPRTSCVSGNPWDQGTLRSREEWRPVHSLTKKF